jgi:AhpD family alkylhydroperoxidase
MAQGYPADRLQLGDVAPRQLGALQRFGKVELDPTIGHLVEMRASQINGCAFCIDMHSKDARAAGESESRLYLLDAWRENPDYDERERAALALAEAMTVLERGGVPDAIWDEAAARFSEEELGALVVKIAAVNTWNRISIVTKAQAGHYQPGDFERPAAKSPEPVGSET